VLLLLLVEAGLVKLVLQVSGSAGQAVLQTTTAAAAVRLALLLLLVVVVRMLAVCLISWLGLMSGGSS
jgi:hypothetical protein